MHNVKRGFIGLGAAAVVAASLVGSGAAIAQSPAASGAAAGRHHRRRLLGELPGRALEGGRGGHQVRGRGLWRNVHLD